MDNLENFLLSKITREGGDSLEKAVAVEFPVTLILNDQELVTLLCSPTDLEYLAAGFLFSEGFLSSSDDIKEILVYDNRSVVRVKTGELREVATDVLFKRIITSGCGRGASFYSAADFTSRKVESKVEIAADEIFALVNKFQHSSRLHLATHGVHSAALCDNKSILVLFEDIGRHNAIDKVFGKCLLEDINIDDRAILTSGRVTSEILHKVAKRGIPIIISVSAPTDMGIKIAHDLGITLVGSVKGRSMDIYANDWRVRG